MPVWLTWAVGALSDHDDDDNKPVWPTWAVGALSKAKKEEERCDIKMGQAKNGEKR